MCILTFNPWLCLEMVHHCSLCNQQKMCVLRRWHWTGTLPFGATPFFLSTSKRKYVPLVVIFTKERPHIIEMVHNYCSRWSTTENKYHQFSALRSHVYLRLKVAQPSPLLSWTEDRHRERLTCFSRNDLSSEPCRLCVTRILNTTLH